MRKVSPFQLGSDFFIFGSRNAYFGVFSRPSEYLLLQCNASRSRLLVRLPSLAFQAQSKTLDFLQNRALNIIFPGVNTEQIELLPTSKHCSHDDSNSHSFSSDSQLSKSLGAMAQAPSGSATVDRMSVAL